MTESGFRNRIKNLKHIKNRTMKKSLILSISFLLAIHMSFAQQEYSVDVEASSVQWTAYHLAKSYSHTGFVQIKSGVLNIKDDLLMAGEIFMDMTTITVSDIEDPKSNEKLTNHLKSKDFFDVANHPEASLLIKSAQTTATDSFQVMADITIRGITKPIAFVAKRDEEGTYAASFRVKRTDHEVLYGWSLENVLIDGEFLLDIKLAIVQ